MCGVQSITTALYIDVNKQFDHDLTSQRSDSAGQIMEHIKSKYKLRETIPLLQGRARVLHLSLIEMNFLEL